MADLAIPHNSAKRSCKCSTCVAARSAKTAADYEQRTIAAKAERQAKREAERAANAVTRREAAAAAVARRESWHEANRAAWAAAAAERSAAPVGTRRERSVANREAFALARAEAEARRLAERGPTRAERRAAWTAAAPARAEAMRQAKLIAASGGPAAAPVEPEPAHEHVPDVTELGRVPTDGSGSATLTESDLGHPLRRHPREWQRKPARHRTPSSEPPQVPGTRKAAQNGIEITGTPGQQGVSPR